MDTESTEGFLQALIVPLRRMNLVVPQSLVIEVVPMPELKKIPAAKGASGVRGRVEWRGRSLVLLSVESYCLLSDAESAGRTKRVAVMKGIAGLEYYAIEIFSIPHPLRLAKTDISSEVSPEHCDLASQYVRAAGVKAMIPDFERIERYLKETVG